MHKFKKTVTLLLALALSLGLAVPAFAAGEPQRGVLTYTETIAPQYDDAGLFIDGLAPVKKDGKWGYINEDGKVAIGFQYDYAWRFNEGYAVVAKAVSTTPEQPEYATATYSYYMEAEIGFIDQNNHYTAFTYQDSQPLIIAFYDVVFDFGGGSTETSRFMPEDETWMFHNGIALIREVNSDGYSQQHIHKTNGAAVVPTYSGEPTGPMNEGLIPMDYGYIDVDGNVVHLFEEKPYGPEVTLPWGGTNQGFQYINRVATFNQGLAPARQETYDAVSDEMTNLIGFLDRDYNWAIQPQYTYWYWCDTYRTCEVFGETGLAAVADVDGKWGAINKKGETVIPFQYELLGAVSSGRLLFKQGGKYGYLDAETYQVSIPAQYEVASLFSGELGLAAVYDGQKAFLIDRGGNTVPGADSLDPSTYFIPNGDGTYMTYTPDAWVVIERNGKYGYGKIDYLPQLPQQSDTTGWAYGEVVEAIEADLVPVYLQNLYRQNITRSEFCDLIVQAVTETLGKDTQTLVLEHSGKTLTALRQEYQFSDTTSANAAAAFALGIVKGSSETTFNPYGQITRQEAAVMLARAARLLGLESGTGVSFSDAGAFADWARDDIAYVSGLVDPVSNGRVMNGAGDGSFSADGLYTREQAILTTLRLFHCAGE